MSSAFVRPLLLRLAAAGAAVFLLVTASPAAAPLNWKSLPPIPDLRGFAGSYAGISHGALLVAGGANFPDRMPWEGGTKVWYDRVFVLPAGAATWREADRLPATAGYGASVTTPDGVLLIGGGDARRNFTAVWRATWDGSAVNFAKLPDLPAPLGMLCAALVDRTVYVAGGLERPDATQAQNGFFALELDHPERGWRELPSCPGPERFLATAGSDGTAFYLVGGARLVPDAQGKPVRELLRDAWRYTPGTGWTRLADLPRAVVAAPSPAVWSEGRLLVLGGDDGAQINVPPDAHHGFPRDILAYAPVEDRWAKAGELPFSIVTTPAVVADGRVIIPGGEKRPGVRSTEVWTSPLP